MLQFVGLGWGVCRIHFRFASWLCDKVCPKGVLVGMDSLHPVCLLLLVTQPCFTPTVTAPEYGLQFYNTHISSFIMSTLVMWARAQSSLWAQRHQPALATGTPPQESERHLHGASELWWLLLDIATSVPPSSSLLTLCDVLNFMPI